MPLLAKTPVDRMDTPYARRWWALLVLCLSLLIIVMANTSLIVAAPDMTRDLGLSSSDLQWVIDGYTVPYAALMLVLGAIGDKYSRRGALVVGLLIFGAGSVMGSLVDETGLVIAARGIMGVGAAVIMPATLSLLVATFPARSEAAPSPPGPPHRASPSRSAPWSPAGCWRTTPGAPPSSSTSPSWSSPSSEP